MIKFEYFDPSTVEDAVALLAQYGDKAKVLAAGTDLLVELKYKKIAPNYVVSLHRIADLEGIIYDDNDGLRIGATTTFHSLETSLLIRETYAPLAEAAARVGSRQVRNVATIGGNLCHAAPSAEAAPALLALEAQVEIRSMSGRRKMPLEEFFVGPGKTALASDEILTSISIPPSKGSIPGTYLKHSIRKAMDLAIVGVAVVIDLDGENECCQRARIALGAVAPTPIRAKRAESLIEGKAITDTLIEEAAAISSEESRPISDVRASADYRRDIVKVLVRRGLRQTLASARAK